MVGSLTLPAPTFSHNDDDDGDEDPEGEDTGNKLKQHRGNTLNSDNSNPGPLVISFEINCRRTVCRISFSWIFLHLVGGVIIGW